MKAPILRITALPDGLLLLLSIERARKKAEIPAFNLN